MPMIKFVYPNVSGIEQRGSLVGRWKLASQSGCEYIEVPADFIKNGSETKKTKLDLCSFIPPKALPLLYKRDSAIPPQLKYILHTEPSLPRSDGYGLSSQAPLKWYDEDWINRLTEMVISICRFFHKPASAIEIHPGDARNEFRHIGNAVRMLLEAFRDEFQMETLIMLENRTGQFISTGEQIADFWAYIKGNCPDLVASLGIVLDIQQLHTCTNEAFIRHLELIPNESIKGLHIHRKHRLPRIGDGLPWEQAFRKIAELRSEVLINPEVHHNKDVRATIEFCKESLEYPK